MENNITEYINKNCAECKHKTEISEDYCYIRRNIAGKLNCVNKESEEK